MAPALSNSNGEVGPGADRSIARTYERFAGGKADGIEQVRTWIGAVVHGGRWGFEDVEAVCQDVLLHLVKLARSGKVQDPQAFKKFVHTVAKNDCLTTIRAQKKRREREVATPEFLEHAFAGPEDPEELTQAEKLDALRFIIQQLPSMCRELWVLTYQERLTSAEVAERLGTTAGNIRVRAHRCLEKARAIYREYARHTGSAER